MGLALVAVVAWQVAVHAYQLLQRSRVYTLARRHADVAAKPLLVAGGPYGASRGYFWWRILKLPPHGYGDVCLDISPKACKGAPKQVIADVREIPFPDKYFGAAFCSHILEHMQNLKEGQKAVNELLRVTNKVFVLGPSKQSILAWLTSGHHLWAYQKEGTIILEERTRWIKLTRIRNN